MSRRNPEGSRLFSPGALAVSCAVLVVGACTTQQVSPLGEGASAVAPVLSVERFLQAANARDLDSMARLFGTSEGPVADTGSSFGCFWKKLGSWLGMGDSCIDQVDVELRMNALALVLRHDDYRVLSEVEVPGRRKTTIRIGIDLTRGSQVFRDVPFNVVRADGGRWLIEEVGIDRITGATGT